MQFEAFDKFRQGNDVWLEGVLNASAGEDMQTDRDVYIAAIVREEIFQGGKKAEEIANNSEQPALYSLGVTEYDESTRTVMAVSLQPHGVIDELSSELREHLASALERASHLNGKAVNPDLLMSIKEGRALEAEREQEAEYTRMTRNVDHDLEAAYITRDALKEKALTALDKGRDAEAKEAMEQLGEVQQSIKDYWNPHKPRPVVSQSLSEDEELEVQLAEMTSDDELTHEAASLAIAEYGKQAADALSRGDVEAHDAAIAKVREYQNVHKSLNDEEKAAFEKAEKDAEGTEFAVEEDSHVARLAQRRAQERKSERGMS